MESVIYEWMKEYDDELDNNQYYETCLKSKEMN